MIFKFRYFFQINFLLFSLFNLHAINFSKNCGIFCLTNNIQNFIECYDEQLVEEFGIREVNVFCDCLIDVNLEQYQTVFLHSISKFQEMIGNYKYVLVVRPEFFKLESLQTQRGKANISGHDINIVYIGDDVDLNPEESGLGGNIYFANLRNFGAIYRFDLLNKLISQTIYYASTLDSYLKGKGIANMYSLKVVLQSYIFYNRIGSNVVRSIPIFPLIIDIN